MVDSQVSTSVSGNEVTINVAISPLDVILYGTSKWEVVISSKTDHGLGSTGSPDYPYYIDNILGDGNLTFTRTLIADQYVAELALHGLGVVDYSQFEITGGGGGGGIGIPAIVSGFWIVNGGSTLNCIANPTDTIQLRCKATNLTIGQQYKAELKFALPTGTNFSFYTEYSAATAITMDFISQAFIIPAPAGVYSTVWFVIYDTSGKTVCSGDGKGSGFCESLTVSCTVPKYKCNGSVCTSDNCDGTGKFADSNCGTGCGGGGTGTGVLASITINKTASVQIGQTVTLTAVCTDTNGNVMTCPSLIWGSDSNNATVDNNGVVTGVSEGIANIIAKDSATSKIASSVVTVTTIGTGTDLSAWLQKSTCLDNTNNKYCAKNWMWGLGIGVAFILLTKK